MAVQEVVASPATYRLKCQDPTCGREFDSPIATRKLCPKCLIEHKRIARARYHKAHYRTTDLKEPLKVRAERGFVLIDHNGKLRDSREYARWLRHNEVG